MTERRLYDHDAEPLKLSDPRFSAITESMREPGIFPDQGDRVLISLSWIAEVDEVLAR